MWNRVAWKQILLHHQRPASKQLISATLRPPTSLAASWFEVTTTAPPLPTRRGFSSSANSNWHSGGLRLAATFEPVSPNDLHRAGGIASFMRLPIVQPPKAFGDLDVAFLGIPLDTATSNRPGAR